MSATAKQVLWFCVGLILGSVTSFFATTKLVETLGGTTPDTVNQRTILTDIQAGAFQIQNGAPIPTLYIGERAVPIPGAPRWVIPGRVKPMINGASAGAEYTYYHVDTGQIEGPFLPDVPHSRP